MCNKPLRGPFKILQRGKGELFDVCMSCFGAIMRKGGPDRYLPGKELVIGKDNASGATLHGASAKPYVPIGTHKLDGDVKIAVNNRTGQILL